MEMNKLTRVSQARWSSPCRGRFIVTIADLSAPQDYQIHLLNPIMRFVWFPRKPILSFLLILGLFLLTCCGQVSSTAPKAPPTLTPIPDLTQVEPWRQIPVPIPGRSLLDYVVSPIDPTTIYTCINDPNFATQHVVLWRTRDAGQHWSRLTVPASVGTSCSISISALQPQRIVYMVYASGDEPACESATLYLSTDGGNTWKHIVHHSSAPDTRVSVFCTITVTSHDLYFVSSYRGEMNTPQQSILERSTDDGDSWEGIDSAFGSGSLFLEPQVGADDTTLAISVWSHVPGLDHQGTTLWMSHDAGSTWQSMGPVSGGTFLLTSHQRGDAWPSSASPFYSLIAEQLPEALYAERVVHSNDGRQWTALPPLPVPGTSVTHLGIAQVLGVTNDGRLLAFGTDPKTGFALPGQADQNAPPTPAFWLWIWNPRLTRWQVLPNPLIQPAHIGCGLCWGTSLSVGAAHTTYLYIYYQDTLYPTSQSFFSIRLPAM